MPDHEKRIRDFLSERATMRGLCPEQISGVNGINLNITDLRALLADLDDARAALTAAKAGGWVPIETAPKDGRRVLVAIEGVDRAVVSFWSGAGWATVDGHDWKGRPVTAWQPLPNPPKEQA